ncbi:MAG: RNA polymerase sigma factor [Candidatus Rifleibacteriota bacterium]
MEKINPEIIKDFSKGDKKSALKLFEQLRRPVYGYLYRMTFDCNIAEDLLQETLLTIYSRIETYNPEFAFMPWAYAIARNKYLQFIRKQKQITRIYTVPVDCLSEISQAGFSGHADLNADIQTGLENLSEPVREAFVLKHFQGFTFVEVARLQEIPLPTAKSRVAWAVRKLRQYLKRGEE